MRMKADILYNRDFLSAKELKECHFYLAAEHHVPHEEDDGIALDRVFAAFNAGSGQECIAFQKSHMRSLSVGDVVGLDYERWYVCEDAGWRRIPMPRYVDWRTEAAE